MRFRQVYFSESAELSDFVDVGGKKKPTKNELGKFIHTTIEGVENFWKWFGESKTVNSKGQPKVFYHQSQSEVKEMFKVKGDKGFKRPNYSQSNMGIYFGDDEDIIKEKYNKSEKGQLVAAYLKIENPLDLDDKDAMYFDGRKVHYAKVVTSNFKKSMSGEKEDAEPDIILYTISPKAKKWLDKNNYDGIYGGEPGGGEEYIVFSSKQIKSVNNSGNFSLSQYIYERNN